MDEALDLLDCEVADWVCSISTLEGSELIIKL